MRKHAAPLPWNAFRPMLAPVLALVLALLLAACAAPRQPLNPSSPFRLTIAHVNDTHSALEPAEENLTLDVDGQRQIVRARLGGMPRLKTGLDALRATGGNLLVLHAGDAVQGTLYFNVFAGQAEFDFLNRLGLDAMCLGNHEFDRGPEHLGRMLALARFPVLASNVDASAEPALSGRIGSYVIREYATPGGVERVGVIGSSTTATPLMTMSVGRVRFLDPAPAIRAAVAELAAQGVNKIVLLSHNGYDVDQHLAKNVPGLDVIVGGHTHSLLGDRAALAGLGLKPAGPYPTEVKGPDGRAVLVVQAWKWGEVLGALSVEFDARGRIAGHSAAPKLLVSEPFRMGPFTVDPASQDGRAIRAAVEASGAASVAQGDPEFLALLAPYAEKIAAFQSAPIGGTGGGPGGETGRGATLRVDLLRGTKTDPGPLVADSYLAKVPGAQIAFVGAGGIRRDLLAGPVTLGQVMGVLPFGNTLVAMDATGTQIKDVLEDAVEFRIATRPPENGDLRRIAVIHTAGLTYVIHPERPKGSRIDGLTLRLPNGTTAPLDPAATYRLVTNSFLAGGGDGLASLKNLSQNRVDTGFLEHDALAEHLAALGAKGEIAPPAGPRVVIELPQSRKGLGQRSSLEAWKRWEWAAAA
ncbi:MAG TPA: bifunctional metallophosphatase/5'-nucleotidase [Humidesulfovibrio sp.]|uniref:bifunctional metallophosphatase/5'-nucleotidase n=1 Tax=Humidesulfovibrio sp. TaxID=2910988 RepID=UPI002B82FCEF|nr:bifunctional metallophosphatase/5'-nucleotidase [Humidesulfovibrio sp.]HWR02620.1 bifunctional metallophosphatase/5'-nucleotidase [Humidesulfovibrio sp.]